jgi:hypothetical protein
MRKLTLVGWSGALSVSALLIAACGGSTAGSNSAPLHHSAAPTSAASTSAGTTSGGASAVDACSVVTNAEVSAVVGDTITVASGAGGICIFQTADLSKSFGVAVYTSVDAMATYLQLEPGGMHLDGVGTDAFWLPSGILFARNGDRGLSFTDTDLSVLGVSTAGATPGPAPDALVQLAKTALGRLG